MILTGPEIRKQVQMGKEWHDKIEEVYDFKRGYHVSRILRDRMDYIDIEPYDESLVGPNSVDLRMGNELLVYEEGFKRHQYMKSQGASRYYIENSFKYDSDLILDINQENKTHSLEIPDDGLILWPGILYLGRTVEVIGSNSFVPIVEGRSSVGRLGVHVHVTAGFCDLGFRGSITLEIHVLHPIRIYSNLPICQAYFLEPRGEIELYKGRYQGQVDPTPSRFGVNMDEVNGDS